MGLMDGIMPKGKGEHPWPDGEVSPFSSTLKLPT